MVENWTFQAYPDATGRDPSSCEEQTFGHKAVVSHQFGCFKSNGVSLELSILVFGYFSIQFYVLLMPQEISVGPVGVTVGMKQIRCFFHLIFDKCVFLAHLSHFWCNKCFVEHLEIQRKGLGRSGLVSIADPWDFCSTGPKHMGSNHCLGVFIGFLGARNSSCSVKLNPL